MSTPTPIAPAPPAQSAAPTPSSSCPPIAPRLSPAILPAPPAENSPPQPSCGVTTHKEWVVPPRPKPGRKPATDTPPTKRKAQNRAAQRAFRERRAARVNELEDKLKELTEETTARDTEFKDQILRLTHNNNELAKENAAQKSRIEFLQRELEVLQKVKTEPQPEIDLAGIASPPETTVTETPQQQQQQQQQQPAWTTSAEIDAVLNDRAIDFTHAFARKKKPAAAAASTPAPTPPTTTAPVGCGREGGCPCAAAANNSTTSTAPSVPISIKRSPSPSFAPIPPKRPRPTSFPYPPNFTSIPDPCGFCSDGTPCVCAEVASAMDMEDSDPEDLPRSVKLAPLMSSSGMGSMSFGGGMGIRDMLTPPASVDGDVPHRLQPVQPPVSNERTGGCPPGGCEQCRSDPMSTLFCQSVNSLARERTSPPASSPTTPAGACAGPTPGGCCGGGGCGGGSSSASNPTSASINSMDLEAAVLPHQRRGREKGKTYIPASAAYQTLSRHKAWESVADLGKLVRPLVIRNEDGRCPEVEVSSVRDVLKMLDLRFGRD